MKILTALATLGLLSLLTLGSWDIDENYVIRFETSGAKGTFKGLKGDIIFDPTAVNQAGMDVSVEVATIATGNDTKDKHARGENWFDAKQFPTIRFVADQFRATTSGYEVTGLLTLHGTTKKITFPFSFTETEAGGLFEGEFEIDRKAYGIKGNLFGFAVGRQVKVALKVPVTKS